MVKLKNPLLSLGARNTLSKAITFVRRRGQNIAEKKPKVLDVQSPAQLSWRHMYQKCAALWHALSAAEKQEWESLARPKHMTGFAYWQSQCLRPNPGIYLPLQGGTMSGEIDMAKNKLLKLPAPADAQEPFRLSDYVTYVLPYLLREGARVYHNAHQNIPHATYTALAFNSERYDTDTIHDNAVNNSRLTCKTPGKYIIIGQVHWDTNAVGYRLTGILLNTTSYIVINTQPPVAASSTRQEATTIFHLALNDYVELWVVQTSTAGLNAKVEAQSSCEFMMQRIGT